MGKSVTSLYFSYMAIFLWKKPGRIPGFGKDASDLVGALLKRLHEMWRINWLGNCECNIMQCSMVSHWQLSKPCRKVVLCSSTHRVGLPLLSYQNYTTGSWMTGFILDRYLTIIIETCILPATWEQTTICCSKTWQDNKNWHHPCHHTKQLLSPNLRKIIKE